MNPPGSGGTPDTAKHIQRKDENSPPFRAGIAQLVERRPEEPSVSGSSPFASTTSLSAGHAAIHPNNE